MIPCVYFSTVDFFRLFIVVKKILVFPIISGVILSFLIYLAWLHRINISYMYFPAVFTLLCIPLSFRNMKWIDMGLNSSYATFTKRVFTISFLLPSSSFNFFSSSRYIIIEILYIYGFLTLWLNLIVCLLFPFSIYFFSNNPEMFSALRHSCAYPNLVLYLDSIYFGILWSNLTSFSFIFWSCTEYGLDLFLKYCLKAILLYSSTYFHLAE